MDGGGGRECCLLCLLLTPIASGVVVAIGGASLLSKSFERTAVGTMIVLIDTNGLPWFFNCVCVCCLVLEKCCAGSKSVAQC
jgi:hypothetical protein